MQSTGPNKWRCRWEFDDTESEAYGRDLRILQTAPRVAPVAGAGGRGRGRGGGAVPGRGATIGGRGAANGGANEPVVEDEWESDGDVEEEERAATQRPMAKDVTWEDRARARTDTVTQDPRVKKGYAQRESAHFTLPNYEGKDAISYLLHFVPIEELETIAAKITAAGKEKGYGDSFNITLGVFLRWLGLWTSMCVDKLGSRKAYWKAEQMADELKGLFCKATYGNFMSRALFDKILSVFVLDMYEVDEANPDPFRPIRKFADAVQNKWRRSLTPSWFIVLDESMIPWLGKGMPGWMHVPRKPHPFGQELKNACDGETGIMINFEIYEGKVPMAGKKWVQQYGATTAQTLRLA